jgi:hypothetical protein
MDDIHLKRLIVRFRNSGQTNLQYIENCFRNYRNLKEKNKGKRTSVIVGCSKTPVKVKLAHDRQKTLLIALEMQISSIFEYHAN